MLSHQLFLDEQHVLLSVPGEPRTRLLSVQKVCGCGVQGPDSSGSAESLTLANLSLRLTMGPGEDSGAAEVLEPVLGELKSPSRPRSPAPKVRRRTLQAHLMRCAPR